MRRFIFAILLIPFFSHSSVCYDDAECEKSYFYIHQALVGFDGDNDGIRDDTENSIEKFYGDSKDNIEVSRNTARVYQMVLNANQYSGKEYQAYSDKISNEISKLFSCYHEHSNLEYNTEILQIKTLVFNNKDRRKAWLRFQSSRNETVQSLINFTYNECRLPQN
jgi:hypothetical protein